MSKSLTDEELFAAALRIQATPDRIAYLEQTCAGNLEQLARVKALLAALDDAGSFLNKPLADFAALGATATPPPVGMAGQVPTDPVAAVPLDFLSPCNSPDALGKLGPYIVEDVIGRGGMGIVLRASDPKLNRVVAIKVLAPEIAKSPMAGKRFLREAQAAAAVSHDHIVRIYAVEDAAAVPYLVMECIVGQSLQQKIERKGILEIREILRIGNQIASGLAAAHKQGLVHRDIKPANILLENGIERVKITDFGLARAVDDVGITQSGQVTGTPQYMSPEQAMGEQVDHRSDLFSLGSVLYTMCTGRPAFRATSTVAVLRRVVDDTPRPIRELNPETPDWLIAIVDRLMAKKPEDRFQSAAEVAAVLEQWLAHYQRPQTVPSPMMVLASDKTAISAARPRGTLRRAWDEWWSERDRWFAISVQSVLVILHLVCMVAFLNFYTARGVQGNKPQFQFHMGSPSPWYRFDINQGDQLGFNSGFYPFTWSVLLGLIGWALYYIVWRIEKARDPKTSWWNRHEVVMSLWGIMAVTGVIIGTVMGHGVLALSSTDVRSAPTGSPSKPLVATKQPAVTPAIPFAASQLKPMLPPWAGADASVKFEEGAWRIENRTSQGNFNVLMGTVLEDIPREGLIVLRAQIKTEGVEPTTPGGLHLGLADGVLGGEAPAPFKYDWPESEFEFRGIVSEWTRKEFRCPAGVFHTKNPPQLQVYVGLHDNGIVWVKDLELLHLSHGVPSQGAEPDRGQPSNSTAVLEELRKQVDLAAQDFQKAESLHKAQVATRLELMNAEVNWITAKLRLAEANGGASPSVVLLLKDLVRLLVDKVKLSRQQWEAGVIQMLELNAAEKELSNARIRLLELRPDNPEPPSLPEP